MGDTMYKSIIALLFLAILGISCQKNIIQVTQNSDNIDSSTISGWTDEDTYTVQASGETEPQALEMAKHQILKDIVNVRVRNQSPYTDITKIRNEFETPLNGGKILNIKNTTYAIQITFQIHEKGLKKKFERK
jgi:hypothetical protein